MSAFSSSSRPPSPPSLSALSKASWSSASGSPSSKCSRLISPTDLSLAALFDTISTTPRPLSSDSPNLHSLATGVLDGPTASSTTNSTSTSAAMYITLTLLGSNNDLLPPPATGPPTPNSACCMPLSVTSPCLAPTSPPAGTLLLFGLFVGEK